MDDRQRAGTPFREQVPDYPALLQAAKNANALLKVVQKSSVTPGDTRPLRIGLLKEAFDMPEMDAQVAACVKRAAEKFRELGAEVVDVSVPGHAGAPPLGKVYR